MFTVETVNLRSLVSKLSVVAAATLLLFPPEILSPLEVKAAALMLVTIGFWATSIIPEHITALLFFLLAMLFSISPPDVVFAGFASAAVWLVFGGLVIGVAISSTGLGKRVATRVALQLEGEYPKIIGGLVLVGILFSFIMPSAMGRVVLLTPIAIAIADHFGFYKGSKGRTGVLLATIMGSYMSAFAILPANVPNMVLIGMAETQYDISPLYGSYFLLHFPVLGLLKAFLVVGLILWFYPDEPNISANPAMSEKDEMSCNEYLLSSILLALLALWMTDFAHHVSPAWVTLGGAIFLLFPGVEIVTKQQFNQKINWSSLFFVAGILGLGGVINNTGLGHTLARQLLSLLPLSMHNDFLNFSSIAFASTVTGIVTTLPGVPAVFTPLSEGISQTTGMSLQTVIMMQVLGFSTPILPYQAPPIIVGMQLAGEKLFSAIKLCSVLAAFTLLFLLPLNYVWWKVIGWI